MLEKRKRSWSSILGRYYVYLLEEAKEKYYNVWSWRQRTRSFQVAKPRRFRSQSSGVSSLYMKPAAAFARLPARFVDYFCAGGAGGAPW